jgi:CRP/FNR family transcriptional regulator
VLDGRVASMEYAADGSEHLFNFFEDGSLFLESNLLFEAPAAVWFRTMRASVLSRISLERLFRAMREDPKIGLFLLRSMSYKYYSAMDQIRNFYNYDASWKIMNLLQLMAVNFGSVKGEWVVIDMKITQQTIGNMLGINRVTVGKVLKELMEVELVMIINGKYCVPYSQGIRRHMDSANSGEGA